MREMEYLGELAGGYPVLEAVKEDTRAAYELLEDCYERGEKVPIAGNGRNCADSEHIVRELMKGLVKRCPASPEFTHALRQADSQRGIVLAEGLQGALLAIALIEHMALSVAFLNNVNGEVIYVQQLYGYGKKEDIFISISTSGSAKNAMYAAAIAKAMGIKVISLVGKGGGALAKASDMLIVVPEKRISKIQELRLSVYHALYLMLEEHFYEV